MAAKRRIVCPACGARLTMAADSTQSRIRCVTCSTVFPAAMAITPPQPPQPQAAPKVKWRGPLIAIIAAVVFFGGCAAMIGGVRDNRGGRSYTPSTSASRHLSDDQIDDASFIGTLEMFHVDYPSKSDAIAQAKALCLWYQANDSFFEAGAMQIMKQNAGYTAEDAGHFAGAATAAYCPQYGPTKN